MSAPVLVQVLCPRRHTIFGLAFKDHPEEMALQITNEFLALALKGKIPPELAEFQVVNHLNPWCGLCGAGLDTWTIEAGRTKTKVWDQAIAELRQVESQQVFTRMYLALTGRTFDSGHGEHN
jgi:hypothetical protein